MPVAPQRSSGSVARGLTLAGLAVAAVALRWQFVDVQSGDYRTFVSRWYAFLQAHGHLAALRDDTFSNYNTPYLVLLTLAGYLPAPALVAVKAISVLGDLAVAWVGSRIVAVVRPGSAWPPVGAFAAVLLLPTVVMNGGVWGQCDSLYAAAGLTCVLACLRGRPWAASAWFGVSLAFKLQAMFLLPVLIGVLVVNRHRLVPLAGAVGTFLACLVPALLAGRGLASQLMVYPTQVADPAGTTVPGEAASAALGRRGPAGGTPPPGPLSPGHGGGAPGAFTLNDGQSFTHNAPTQYAWLPAHAPLAWKYTGLALTAAVLLAFGIWLIRRRRVLSPGQILLVAATATLLVPICLPEMHERSFYLGEVLTVLAAFADRRFALPAVGIQLASVSTYLAYLLDRPLVPLSLAAAVAVPSAALAAVLLVRALSPAVGPGHDLTPSPPPGLRLRGTSAPTRSSPL